MSKHDLENMIFNLEERKDLKKVEFTQKAVIEILGYLKQLADLEAKLAESESIRKGANEEIKNLHKRINEIVERDKNIVTDLKQQLAEKEKEIEELKHFKISIGTMKNNQVDISSTTYVDQDKISFCIDKLEKVKEWCENYKFSDEYDYVITYEPDEEDSSGCIDYLKDYINNQIEELTHQSEDKN